MQLFGLCISYPCIFLVENIFYLLHKQNASVKKCRVKAWTILAWKLQICAYNKKAYKTLPLQLTTGYILHMCEDVNCCNMYLFCTCNVMYLKNVGMHLFQKGKTDSCKHVWLNELYEGFSKITKYGWQLITNLNGMQILECYSRT